jgi:hypothetical protein
MSETVRRLFLGATGLAAAADAGFLYRNQETLAGLQQNEVTFPADLNRNVNVPYISMRFVRYRRRSIYEQPTFNDVMKISLPIPENLTESTEVGYTNENLGSTFGAVTESLSGATNISGPEDIANRIAGAAAGAGVNTIAEIIRGRLGVGTANANPAIAQSIQSATTAASVLSGITANPFQVVLFKSPEFRRHSFTWKLVPRDLDESERIKILIDVFKYHSLPGLSPGAVFFSYPEVLEIKFRPSDNFLYKFKPCVVRNVTVNYAPNSPSFYRSSNAPTAVQFRIDLQEIEIITKADYLRTDTGRYGGIVTEVRNLTSRTATANPAETNAAQAFPGGGAGGFGL